MPCAGKEPKMKKDEEAQRIFDALEGEPETDQVPLMLRHLVRLRVNAVAARNKKEKRAQQQNRKNSEKDTAE
jgi:hypothetical protein